MHNDPELESSSPDDKPVKALLKKQRREERQRGAARLTIQRKQRFIRACLWGIPLVLLALGLWAIVRSPKTSHEDNPVISRRGIHWHPNVEIWIKGERVTIPANIGLGGGLHADTHTHKENDQIHLEMSRPVRVSDTRVLNFFKTWGEEFTSQCIIDACNGDEGRVKMFVNGQENFEFEQYPMKDGDHIVIRYE